MIPKVRAEKRLGSYRLLQMNSAHADRMLTDFPQIVHMGPFHWSGYLMIQSRIGVSKNLSHVGYLSPKVSRVYDDTLGFLSQSLLSQFPPTLQPSFHESFPVEGKRLKGIKLTQNLKVFSGY